MTNTFSRGSVLSAASAALLLLATTSAKAQGTEGPKPAAPEPAEAPPVEPAATPPAKPAETPPTVAPAPAAVIPTAASGKGVSLGITVLRFQDDFGMSALVGTPTFAGDKFRISLGGGLAWSNRGLTKDGAQAWDHYGHLRLVTEGGLHLDDFPVRLYGFGGFVALFVPSDLSHRLFWPGGIGGFGFEFYMRNHGKDGPISFFIELGGVGTGASADRITGKPILASGFFSNTGLRINL